jgi:hypothetical protein
MSPSDLEQVSIPDTLGILRLPAYTCLYCITPFFNQIEWSKRSNLEENPRKPLAAADD